MLFIYAKRDCGGPCYDLKPGADNFLFLGHVDGFVMTKWKVLPTSFRLSENMFTGCTGAHPVSLSAARLGLSRAATHVQGCSCDAVHTGSTLYEGIVTVDEHCWKNWKKDMKCSHNGTVDCVLLLGDSLCEDNNSIE